MLYLKSKSEKRTYDKTRQRLRKPAASVGGDYGAEIDTTYVDAVASRDVQLKLAEFMVIYVFFICFPSNTKLSLENT